MWRKLSALEKALLFCAGLVTVGWTARSALGEQSALPDRVDKVELRIQQLEVRQDSADSRVGRMEGKLDRIACYVRAMYENSKTECIGQ